MKKIIHYFTTGLKSIPEISLYIIKYLISGSITILSIIPKYFIIGFKYVTEKKDSNNPNQDVLGIKLIPSIIISLSILTYLLCIFILTRWYVQNERNKRFTSTLTDDILAVEESMKITDEYNDLTKEVKTETKEEGNKKVNTNYINVNLDYYISKNKETVAWIQVNNTNINYPVTQHDDNNYYLNYDFYNRKTDIGWIFADYRDNFNTFNNNTIIYGHNIINRTMFGQLPFLLRKGWFNSPNSHYIKLSTKTTNTIWQIFSVYKIKPTTDYLQSNFNSIETYQEFLNTIKSRSEQKFDVSLDYTDKIITLSTCDDTGTKRVVIHAKLINIEDKK